MSEISREELEPQPPSSEQSEPILGREQEAEIETEMPEDFVEPKGKSGKWSEPVKGEVEVEGKKVEVFYREKVIELPKHRQEETGIKRIRRRELLSPFPEGLYISGEERKKRIHGQEMLPIYMADEKFDNFYKFLTNGKYPKKYNLIHNLDYEMASGGYDNSGISRQDRDRKNNIKQFKSEGLYFQEISSTDEGKHTPTEQGRGKTIWFTDDRPWFKYFTTPVFIFNSESGRMHEYIKFLEKKLKGKLMTGDVLSDTWQEGMPIIKDSSQKLLRWCHADLALVPTKRSLNVLFFETGDKEEQEKIEVEK